MAADDWMRAADGDRESAAEILRLAYAEGRLGREELDDRTEAVYQARTWGELRRVIDDLPPPGARPAGLRGQPWRPPARPGRAPPARRVLRLSAVLIVAAIAAAVTGAAVQSITVVVLAVLAGIMVTIGSRD